MSVMNTEIIGPLAILTLVGFMLLKEFVRTMDRSWARKGMIVLNAFILPLMIVAALVMVFQLLSLLNPG